MHTIATLLNVLLLAVVGYLVTKSGIPKGEDLWIFLLFVLTPIVSLIALRLGSGSDWVSLFFQRKALEERKRIEALTSKK